MSLVIRAYEPADRAAVVDLVHQLNLFEDGISADRARDVKAAATCLDADLARVARDGGAVVVAADGDEVIAMMCFVLEQPQPYLKAEIARVAWVSELVVDERHRGQGIGTALLEEAERLARAHGVSRLMIGAIVGNHVARKAYERFGFRPAVVELAKDLE
ncbi:GNAT family N-acetyltransferase [Phreatobacter sp.]|uniref:GNAT family N-acetyltransferase n=1 Tax=Phreatobacter sp. TaxID=1966341 RepID=UPI0022BB4DDA|nr:GNAT family N-acetyltransferase [Phreatobacter sp.]MCZ8316402.1 GNAT family N-acetyltransferase [Phreatobacter sp.]